MTSEGPAMTDAPANVPEDMERILSVADDADARELRSRLEAREAANALVSKSPTSGNVRSADMASRSFQDCLGRLLQKYFGHGQVFANRTEAWRWLQAQGYSIQKTSVYNHARKGLLKLQQDGSILLRDLEHYAATHLEKLANKGPEDMDREVARRKAKADADRAEAEADRARVKADLAQGRVIDKGILVQTLAAVVGAIEDAMYSRMQTRVGDVIEAVGGDQGRGREALGLLLAIKDEALREAAASADLEVVFYPGMDAVGSLEAKDFPGLGDVFSDAADGPEDSRAND